MGADSVVVGDLVHSGLTGLIVGSTAEAIIKHLDCSVLVIKSPGFITPGGRVVDVFLPPFDSKQQHVLWLQLNLYPWH
jgi:hypothetical protein